MVALSAVAGLAGWPQVSRPVRAATGEGDHVVKGVRRTATYPAAPAEHGDASEYLSDCRATWGRLLTSPPNMATGDMPEAPDLGLQVSALAFADVGLVRFVVAASARSVIFAAGRFVSVCLDASLSAVSRVLSAASFCAGLLITLITETRKFSDVFAIAGGIRPVVSAISSSTDLTPTPSVVVGAVRMVHQSPIIAGGKVNWPTRCS